MAITLVVSVRKFKARFPEFRETDPEVVTAKLEDAQQFVAADVWGDRQAQGIQYQAAHLLAMAPLGEQAKLKKENRGTIYGDQFEQLKRIVANRPTVI